MLLQVSSVGVPTKAVSKAQPKRDKIYKIILTSQQTQTPRSPAAEAQSRSGSSTRGPRCTLRVS